MAAKNFSYDDCLQYISVSRETYGRLGNYIDLVEKWQKTINLVGSMTIPEIWVRHIIDSAQLYNLIDERETVVDLGSGAGFPGLVLAIMGHKKITAVESDGRKSAFLKEAARISEAEIQIKQERAENIDLGSFSLITARGFAPLAALLKTVSATLKPNHKMLLHKGKRYLDEIQHARNFWSFDYAVSASVTDKEGVILSMQHFKKLEGML